jgi:hypothetical protein
MSTMAPKARNDNDSGGVNLDGESKLAHSEPQWAGLFCHACTSEIQGAQRTAECVMTNQELVEHGKSTHSVAETQLYQFGT